MAKRQMELFELPGEARQLYLTCRRCRRSLRSDSSRRAGYGPQCLRLTTEATHETTEARTDGEHKNDTETTAG